VPDPAGGHCPGEGARGRPCSHAAGVANAELIVIGKLGKVEDKNVSATPGPGAKDKVEYQVIALSVEQVLLGKADKEIRLAFIPPQNPPAGAPIRPRPFRGVVFSGGQEGVFFLTKHHAENFHVAPMFFDFLDKKNNTYDTDLDTIKRCVKLLEDPNKSLQAKDRGPSVHGGDAAVTVQRREVGAHEAGAHRGRAEQADSDGARRGRLDAAERSRACRSTTRSTSGKSSRCFGRNQSMAGRPRPTPPSLPRPPKRG
jgi:hypothetical protein